MPMSEVFQHVRAQYESKPVPREVVGPGHAKVVARDEEWFITELLDKWRVDYERRKLHHHTGYFALNNVPYRTFANLRHTDVYDILGEHLNIMMNRHYAFMQHYSRNQATAETTASVNYPELHNTIVVVCDEVNKKAKQFPPSKTGGLSAIRAVLGSDRRVLRDVAAGGSLRVALLQEKELGGGGKDLPNEKTTPNNNTKQQAGEASSDAVYLQDGSCPLSLKAENEAPGQEDRGDNRRQSEDVETVGPNLYVALAAVHFKNRTSSSANKPATHQLKETIKEKRHQQRHVMAKLKSVYAILCCLHNIKSRDLKNQEPLSYSTVKALAAKPLHSLAKNLPHLHQHHLHVDAHHRPTSSPQLLPHRHSMHHRGQMASRHVKLDSPAVVLPSVETWEELVHLERCQPSRCSSPHPAGHGHATPTTAGATTTLHRPPRTGSTHAPQKPHKVLPPWQQQILFVKNKSESLKRDPAKKLQDCIDLFQQFKSEISQHVKSTLEDREYQLHAQKHMLSKMEHLVLGANMNMCLEKMREQAYLLQRLERAEEHNKPAWFAVLEKEVQTVFDVQDKEGNTMIEKMKQFTQIDINTLPHVMEKMCLLIMSLPASQLSIQPVMESIEFVLEHVLKQSPKLLTQLKNFRHLPPITTELMPTPVYVFGHRV